MTVVNTATNEHMPLDMGNKFTMPAADVNVVATFKKSNSTAYAIKVEESANGKVTANLTSAKEGANVELTIRPDANYVLDALIVRDASNTIVIEEHNPDLKNSGFAMPKSAATVTATFKRAKYEVEIINTTGGTVTIGKTGTFEKGETISVTVATAEEYNFKSMIVTAGSTPVETKKNNNTFTFTMPAADVKVQASFDKIKYDVKVAEVTGGKATIAETSYAKDDIVEVAIAPAEGYAFKSLTVKNGDTELELETITNKKKYSFKMTNAAVNVEPAFEKISYDVKFGEMTNGTVEADKAKATIGDTVTLTVKPDSGYILDTLTVMNGSKEVEYQKKNATTYTFTMPASKNVLVSATYKVAPVEYEVTYDGGDFVNIRETASKTGTDLGDIPNGTVLEALEVTSEWVKVQYKDITGWVAMLNLTKVTN